MSNNEVKFISTDSSTYNKLGSTIDENSIYFLTDTSEIYKGSNLYSSNIIDVSKTGFKIKIDNSIKNTLDNIHIYGFSYLKQTTSFYEVDKETYDENDELLSSENDVDYIEDSSAEIVSAGESENLKLIIQDSNGETTILENLDENKIVLRGIEVDSDSYYNYSYNNRYFVTDEIDLKEGCIISRIGYINSYNISKDKITTKYISSTGDLREGAEVIYVLEDFTKSYVDFNDIFIDEAKTINEISNITIKDYTENVKNIFSTNQYCFMQIDYQTSLPLQINEVLKAINDINISNYILENLEKKIDDSNIIEKDTTLDNYIGNFQEIMNESEVD
jgi:hypothetical protein